MYRYLIIIIIIIFLFLGCAAPVEENTYITPERRPQSPFIIFKDPSIDSCPTNNIYLKWADQNESNIYYIVQSRSIYDCSGEEYLYYQSEFEHNKSATVEIVSIKNCIPISYTITIYAVDPDTDKQSLCTKKDDCRITYYCQ